LRLRQSRDPCWQLVRLGASNDDGGSAREHRWDVQHDPPRNVPQHESVARDPVRAIEDDNEFRCLPRTDLRRPLTVDLELVLHAVPGTCQ